MYCTEYQIYQSCNGNEKWQSAPTGKGIHSHTNELNDNE